MTARKGDFQVARKKEKRAINMGATMPQQLSREDTELKTRKYSGVLPGVVNAIEEWAPLYGSQGRALQVATEILIRQTKPIRLKSKMKTKDGQTIVVYYKILPRTIQLIDRLTPVYGTRATVLAACAEILQHPK